MNAPCQVNINKLRKKIDLPPVSNHVDLRLQKNAPHKTKSSKLMQQLQQKKIIPKPNASRNQISKLPYSISSTQRHRKNSKSIGSGERVIILNPKAKPGKQQIINHTIEPLIDAHDQIFMNQTVETLKPSGLSSKDYKLGNRHLNKNGSQTSKNREFTQSSNSDKENLGIYRMQQVVKKQPHKVEQKARLSKVLKTSNYQKYY